MPCPIPLSPCYSPSLLEIISIHHCYTWHPQKHTHTPFSFFLPYLTPSPGLFCTHLAPMVLVEHSKMPCSLSWKDGYWEHGFICSLLALSPYATTAHCSVWLLFIHCLVLTTCSRCFWSQKMKAVSAQGSCCTGQIGETALLLFPSSLMSCTLCLHFSAIIYEVGFFRLNLKCPVPLWRSYCKCCQRVWSFVKPSGSWRGHAQVIVITMTWAVAGPFYCT